jgi:hypothetical protein
MRILNFTVLFVIIIPIFLIYSNSYSQSNFLNKKSEQGINKTYPEKNIDEENAEVYRELKYGHGGNPDSKEISSSFSKNGNLDFALGLTGVSKYFIIKNEIYYKLSSNRIFKKENDNGKVQYGMSSFGIAPPKMCYSISEKNFHLYSSLPFDLSWTKISISRFADNSTSGDINYLENFNNSIRFGNIRQSGLLFNTGKKISFDLGFESKVIYPRYKFLQHSLSNFTELVLCAIPMSLLGNSMVISDLLTIKEFSYSGEIVSWILQSAITLGFQELRKNNMFWPLSSDKPVFMNEFKIGIGYTF